MENRERYLTIHGHFYQPPRENPWLEAIELQDSALPWHDWNERICSECYNPNSVSRIVNNENRIIDIVNNYSLMSFNFGPTLMSWMEEHHPQAYERIVKADCESIQKFSGHGNAIAQVYNHIIMPLANNRDKYTQTLWGIKDFQYRFGRMPEGIWLAETAVDDETLDVLVDCGIKFTILSPYQGLRVRKLGSQNWEDVSWGNIDPARAYRYYIKSDEKHEKFIDLFFYDGSISKSVAFDNLLKDGNKFIQRISEGVSDSRNYNQLINIGTDGESYGHHTKFGDMALSYILKIKAKERGFKLTNYGEYLEKEPPIYEADIKQGSSWSCFHGVGRWKEDCGCSTGGQANWNQKWRKPLREALDQLRDGLIELFENEASQYLKDPWKARNNYIEVILDRNEKNIDKFLKNELIGPVDNEGKSQVIKLLEMQRQAMLMYTSCGWFFSEISGIETVQIMKYAARAIQLAQDFSSKDFETPFVDKLSEAKSNIESYGTGKDIYEKFVKPSVITIKQVVSHWAISSLFEDYPDDVDLYCYKITRKEFRKVEKGKTTLLTGVINIKSKITLEESDMMFALLQYSGGDFHCAIREYVGKASYAKIQSVLVDKYLNSTLTEVIRALDDSFGKEYYTIKDIFFEERRKILKLLLQDKLSEFSSTYQNLYDEGKSSIYELHSLGLEIPAEFKLAAEYSLSQEFNNTLASAESILDKETIAQAIFVNDEATKIGINLNKSFSSKIFSKKLSQNILQLSKNMELHQAEIIEELLDDTKLMKLNIDITEAQNVYYNNIFLKMGQIINNIKNSDNVKNERMFILQVLKIGEKLNICVENARRELDKATSPLNIMKN